MTERTRDEKICFIMESVGVPPRDQEACKKNFGKLSDEELDAKVKKYIEMGARLDQWRKTRSPAMPPSGALS